ncbi:MAG: gluconokinase [Planctomycetota bacterium]
MTQEARAMVVILMGVSGAGKTTIGQCLAKDLGWPFYEGDDFHPQTNIDKMRQGIALNDADRDVWLIALESLISELVYKRQSAVIACSALKCTYRKRLQTDVAMVQFVYLKGNFALIQKRLQERCGHFMNADLLANQFDTLEEPVEVLTIDVAQEPEVIVGLIKSGIGTVT